MPLEIEGVSQHRPTIYHAYAQTGYKVHRIKSYGSIQGRLTFSNRQSYKLILYSIQ